MSLCVYSESERASSSNAVCLFCRFDDDALLISIWLCSHLSVWYVQKKIIYNVCVCMRMGKLMGIYRTGRIKTWLTIYVIHVIQRYKKSSIVVNGMKFCKPLRKLENRMKTTTSTQKKRNINKRWHSYKRQTKDT